jgi:RHS repeat-associated protein
VQTAVSGQRSFEPPYIEVVLDAQVPSKGININFLRFFPQDSNHPPEMGPFGYGWEHSFDIRLENSTNSLMAFHGPYGLKQWFKDFGNGTFVGASGDNSMLIRDKNGTFALIDKEGLTYFFRPDLLLDFIAGPKGDSLKAIYNSKNQLVEIKHSTGQTFYFSYNSYDRISKVVDPTGRETSYEYSNDGDYLVKVIGSGGRTISYAYGEDIGNDHRLLNITYSDGTHKFYEYDSQGRIASQEGDEGADRIVYSYGVDGTTKIKNAAGGELTVKVSEVGLPTEVRTAGGSVTKYTYDSNFRLNGITDPLGREFNLVYDGMGNIVQIVRPDSYSVNFGYEPNLNKLIWIKDSLGRITDLSYDTLGDLQSISYPDNSTEMFNYSKDRILESKTDRDGQITNFSFNDQGLISSKTFSDGTSVNYTYDGIGRMTKVSDSNSAIYFEYDSADNLVRLIYPGNRIFKYDYDSEGKRIKMTDPDGKALLYEYDKAGRLFRIRDGTGKLEVEYQYNDANIMTKKTLGNGAYTTYNYDLDGQLLKQINYDPKGKEISHFYYTYDAAGNVLSKDTIEGIESYAYDALGQLSSIRSTDGNQTEITYDSLGNRVKVTENGKPFAYTINNLNQYNSIGSTTYEYDANGNLMYKKENGKPTYYEYDPENNLLSVEGPMGKVIYTYNPLGLRSSRTYGKNITRYLWDGDQVVIEQDENNRTKAKYTWGDALDEPIQMERGDSTYYYTQDALLSTSDLMDVSGNVLEHYKYSAFGEPLSKSIYANSLLFTGASYDPITVLQYNRYRFYSPTLGRFITQDPIGLQSDLNYYTYVKNRYTRFNDPYGLFFSNGAADFLCEWLMADYEIPSGRLPGFALWSFVGFWIAVSSINPFEGNYLYYNGNEGTTDTALGSSSTNYPKYYMKFNDPFTFLDWRYFTLPLYHQYIVGDAYSLGGWSRFNNAGHTGNSGLDKSNNDHDQNGPPPYKFNNAGHTGNSGLDKNNNDHDQNGPPPYFIPASATYSKSEGINEVQDIGDERGQWKLKSSASIHKSESNPLSSATSEFTNILKFPVENSNSGVFKLETEERKATGEERYTIYEHQIGSDTSSSGGRDWIPLSTPQAGVAVASMGYNVPDSLDFIIQQMDEQRQISDQIMSTQQQMWQMEQMQQIQQQTQQQVDKVIQFASELGQRANQIQQAQIAIQQLDEAQKAAEQVQNNLGGVNFTSIQLNYISMRNNSISGENDFNFVLKAQGATGNGKQPIDLKDAASLSARSFLTGLTIPDSKFWVNLNPWEEDRIIDRDLSSTDVGRIMLEADLQMKKDFSNYEDPCKSKLGADYWKLLDKKSEELVANCMIKYPDEIQDARNITFYPVSRHWIVPDKVNVYGNGNEVYLANATMKIYSEPVSEHSYFDIANQDRGSLSKGCREDLNLSAKVYGNYVKEIEDKLILPHVVEDINGGDKYSELRQVYFSLALAQWYKQQKMTTKGVFYKLVNSANLTGLNARTSWSAKEIWNRYLTSFTEKEFHCWQNSTTNSTYQGDDLTTVTKTRILSKYYSVGGVDFEHIADNMTTIGDLTPRMKEITSEAIQRLFAADGKDYYSGNDIYAVWPK